MFAELLVTLPLEQNSLILELFLHLRALRGEKSLEHVVVLSCWFIVIDKHSPCPQETNPWWGHIVSNSVMAVGEL